MRTKFLLLFVIFALNSCQRKEKRESKNIIKSIVQDTLSKTLAGTADLSDVSVHQNKIVKMIQKELTEVLLKKDLSGIPKKDRFFIMMFSI